MMTDEYATVQKSVDELRQYVYSRHCLLDMANIAAVIDHPSVVNGAVVQLKEELNSMDARISVIERSIRELKTQTRKRQKRDISNCDSDDVFVELRYVLQNSGYAVRQDLLANVLEYVYPRFNNGVSRFEWNVRIKHKRTGVILEVLSLEYGTGQTASYACTIDGVKNANQTHSMKDVQYLFSWNSVVPKKISGRGCRSNL